MTPAEDEMLMRYADGAATPQEALEAEALIARDPRAADAVAQRRAMVAVLRGAFDPVLAEPIPDRLILAAQPQAAAVLPFRLRQAAHPRWAAAAMAAAACLAVGVFVGRMSAPGDALIAGEAGRLSARGALLAALERAPSGEVRDGVRIVLSIPGEGGVCRAFETRGQSGLACVEETGWRVVALADRPADAGAGDYRPASGPPEEILAAIEARRAGDPLDPEAEAQALRQGWR